MGEDLLGKLRKLNRGVAILVGIMLLACVAFVLMDILLRQVDSSFGGTDEISGYVMAIATAWGMAFTLLELGHVRIDMMRCRFQLKSRVFLDLFCLVVLAVVITLIAWNAWPVVSNTLANNSRANTPLETPLLLIQAPWFAGWIWFAAMSWLTFLAAVMMVVQDKFDVAENAIGAFGEEDLV